MTFGSLFAGIGGIDLGLERAGMECLGNSVVPQVVEWIGYRIMLANMGPQEAGALLKGRTS